MHELSVTQSLLEIALQHARSANANQITDLHLVIGEFATIVDDSVQFYWDMISAGTIAEGAVLHFQRIPVLMRCMDCDQSFEPTGGELLCPVCGGINLRLQKGDEFYLESIDVV